MTNVLSLIYSPQFIFGMVAGILGMRLGCWAEARHEDHVHPLPRGRRHRVGRISRVWVGGLITVGTLGYVLLQVSRTEARYVALAQDVRHCQVEFQQSLVARSKINDENAMLFRERGDLLQEYAQATGLWIGQLVHLPPEIADLPIDDPKVTAWWQAVTRMHSDRTLSVNLKLDAIGQRMDELERQRRDFPLPQATCGIR